MYKSRQKTNHRQISITETDPIYNSEIVKYFQVFAKELEEKHDRYERILKISRDITIESKRLIFLLHTFRRGTLEGEKVLTEAKSRLVNLVNSQFSSIIKELHEKDIYQFSRSYSIGVQEFVEALTFYNYLLTDKLLTYEELREFLEAHSQPINSKPSDDEFLEKEEFEASEKCFLNANITNEKQSKEINNQKVKEEKLKQCPKTIKFVDRHCVIGMVDYVLGLNDLTGELMRYCINQVSSGQIRTAFDICHFLTNLYTGMLSVGFNNREFNRKMCTVIQSVKKVEMACYTVRVRGSEIPKHMIINMLENEDEHDSDIQF